MPSTSNAVLRTVAMLAVLALHVTGMPVAEASGDAPQAGAPGSLGSSKLWHEIIDVIKPHRKLFEDEFKGQANYSFLEHYEFPKPEPGCLSSSNKESCFQKVAQGLYKYMVFLEFAEKELSNISVPRSAKDGEVDHLIRHIKQKMRHPEHVAELTTSEKEKLLSELNKGDDFQRRMTSHSILRELHLFLIDGHRAVRNKE